MRKTISVVLLWLALVALITVLYYFREAKAVNGFLEWVGNPGVTVIVSVGTGLCGLITGLMWRSGNGGDAFDPMTLFSIEWTGEDYWVRHSGSQWLLGTQPALSNPMLVIKAYLRFNTYKTVLVETLELDIGEQSLGCDWEPQEISNDAIGIIVYFEVPGNLRRGKRTATLKAVVDGKPYKQGSPFILELPPTPTTASQ